MNPRDASSGALHRGRTTSIVAACVGLALLLGAPPDAAAAKPARRPKPEKVRFGPAKELDALLAARTGLATAEARMEAAAAAGPRTITGTERLTGTVYASSLVIAAGSDVTIEGGATLCISGDLTVDAKVTGVLGPSGPAAKEQPVEDILFQVGGFARIAEPLEGADGRDRDFLTSATSVSGREGGPGQGFGFLVGGEIYVGADITPGRGGDGGSVTAEGVAPPQGLLAVGGDGGAAGGVRIVKPNGGGVTFEGGRIRLRRGGRGGDATATGLEVDPGADCGANGAKAGPVTALGGNGGRGSVLEVAPGIFFLGPDGLPLLQQTVIVVAEEDVVEVPMWNGTRLVTDSGGGDATAAGGAGGSPPDCPPVEPCPARGRRPGRGGHGAVAKALAGNGGSPPAFAIPETAFAAVTIENYKRFEVFAGRGGDATASGGNAGKGAGAGAALRPFAGGKGGDGGRAEATPGSPGSLTQFRVPKGVLAFPGRSVLPDFPPDDVGIDLVKLVGALYGKALAVGGGAGTGGKGGDCCGALRGGKGAAGGPAGARGPAAVRFGFPGVAEVMGPEHYRAVQGAGASSGAAGEDCPVEGGGGSGTGSANDPFTLPAFNGACPDLNPTGAFIVGFDFYVPGTVEGLAAPPRSTLLEFGSTLFGPNGENGSIRVEILVNGKRVKDDTIPDAGRVTPLSRVYVATPASGVLCVEIRINGAVTQRYRGMLS